MNQVTKPNLPIGYWLKQADKLLTEKINEVQAANGVSRFECKGAKLTQVDDIVWTRTIADVRVDTAEHYCADVHDWAIAVLADTAALVQTLGNPS
jgi:hypothetical protein